MQTEIIYGILIPFIGTTAGAACVFFLRRQPHFLVQRSLTGFAAGVMTAASVWSLLIPAMEQSEGLVGSDLFQRRRDSCSEYCSCCSSTALSRTST